MIRIKNEIFVGSNGRKSLVDITIPENFNHKIIFFVHGYKGYKDWGAWNEIEKQFVFGGYAFVKFNLTHNGGTIDEPIDFPDLDAFSENTYSKEIFDIESVLNDFKLNFHEVWQSSKRILIGHSRGGGDVILTARHNQDQIDALVTWAAIADIEERFPSGDELEKWKEEGVMFVENSRTQQMMPHKFSMYEDFLENMDALNIQSASSRINIPWLILHGDQDLAVPLNNAERLKAWSNNARLEIIKGGTHTFNTAHPFEEKQLPKEAQELVDLTRSFLDQL